MLGHQQGDVYLRGGDQDDLDAGLGQQGENLGGDAGGVDHVGVVQGDLAVARQDLRLHFRILAPNLAQHSQSAAQSAVRQGKAQADGAALGGGLGDHIHVDLRI